MSNRQRVISAIAAILTGLLLGVGGWLLVGYVEHRRETDEHLSLLAAETQEIAAEAKRIAEENGRTTVILLDCTTPTPPPTADDPNPAPHECYERGQRGQSGAIVEVDCRGRRMQARLPAPADPRRPCVEQTPAEVYPGIAGQPPR